MPNAGKTGVIFLTLGFVMYLAWKQELETYLAFATTKAGGASSSGGSSTNASGGALPDAASAINSLTLPGQLSNMLGNIGGYIYQGASANDTGINGAGN